MSSKLYRAIGPSTLACTNTAVKKSNGEQAKLVLSFRVDSTSDMRGILHAVIRTAINNDMLDVEGLNLPDGFGRGGISATVSTAQGHYYGMENVFLTVTLRAYTANLGTVTLDGTKKVVEAVTAKVYETLNDILQVRNNEILSEELRKAEELLKKKSE